jgi:hypothetical protein
MARENNLGIDTVVILQCTEEELEFQGNDIQREEPGKVILSEPVAIIYDIYALDIKTGIVYLEPYAQPLLLQKTLIILIYLSPNMTIHV